MSTLCGRTDDPDPVTGLTSRDRFLMASSWEMVRKNPIEHGVKLLMMFFEKYPHYQTLFPFSDVPLQELPKNQKFRSHCKSVIDGFSSMTDNINDNELVETIYIEIGEVHRPKNASEEAFVNLKDVLLEYFATFMGEHELEAWRSCLAVSFPQMIKGLKNQIES